MLKPILAAALALVSLFLLAPAAAWAWDVDADRAVGDLAYERLSPAIRAKVDEILARQDGAVSSACRLGGLSGAPAFLDCVKGRKGDPMRGVRYDPIALCDSPAAPPGDCTKIRCASQVLREAVQALGAPETPPAERAAALAIVAYLTAEIHEPLHAADNGDRNGDRVRVILPGSSDRRLTLYAVWDEDFVADAIGAGDDALPYLRPLAEAHAQAWSQGAGREGDIAAWLADTHQIAVAQVYGRLPGQPPCGKPPERPEFLDRSYVDSAVPLVRTQLAKAAVRLAALLEAVLG